jgi:hypothetical protein
MFTYRMRIILWRRIALYPVSLRRNFAVCPHEPLLKLGALRVKRYRGTLVYLIVKIKFSIKNNSQMF